MTSADVQFVGSIPETYERLLVPLLFEDYARDLAERVSKMGAKAVLETAAGTGVVTRALAAILPADASIVATDLNPAMLNHGNALVSPDVRINYQQADAQALAFADGTFDAVVCQFGVMFLPDKVKGYQEARRVLKPGGHFLFNVWDRIAENDFAIVVHETVAGLFERDPPQFLGRTPYAYFDHDQIRQQLKPAGFSSISIETLSRIGRGKSALDVATAFVQGTPLRGEIEARDASRLADITQKAAMALAARFGGGPIEGRLRAHVITAAV